MFFFSYFFQPKFDVTWKQVPPLLHTFDPEVQNEIRDKVVLKLVELVEKLVNGFKLVVTPELISHKFPCFIFNNYILFGI